MVDTVIVAPRSGQERISWTAIFSGWLVALGFAWLFYIMGVAVGFSAFDVNASDSVAKGIGIGTTIWVILTWAVSLFLGGMFASWVDARPNTTVGALHGVAVWGLASGMTLLLAAMGFTNLLQGAAGLVQTSAAMGAATAAGAGGGSETPLGRASSLVGTQLKRAVAQTSSRQNASTVAASGTTGGPAPTPPTAASSGTAGESRPTIAGLSNETTAAAALDLLRGRNDDAKARLVADSGLQPAEVDSVLQSLSSQLEKSKAQIKDAAEQVRRYSAAALWAVVLSTIIGLIAAAFGGSLGAGQVERFYDDRSRRAHGSMTSG